MIASLNVAPLARQLKAREPDRARRNHCERELVRLFQAGGPERDAVVEAFMPFAMSFALKLKRGEEPLDDLRQVATLGLLKALNRFDPQVGDSFVAFAAPTILGELRRHYRDTGWAVHVPRGKQELAQRIARAEREVRRDGGIPSAEVVAERLDETVEAVVEGRVAANALRAGSIDRPVVEDDAAGATIGDLNGEVDAGYERVEDRATIAQLTAGLPERERLILALRFGEGKSQRQIGREIGVSQMQVSRLLRQVVQDLQASAD